MRNKSRRFLEALLLEVQRQSAAFVLQPETLYFGGGTPTALSISELDHLLTRLRERLDFSRLREFTFEINPATVSLEKAKLLRRHGVNRLSMGVQSWSDETLRTLGRAHTAVQSERTFNTLRQAGFDNINLDLMFAVPGQSPEQWRESLAKTIALAPEHVSAYCLTYEEDTAFFRRLATREFQRDDDHEADFFEMAMDALGAAGYAHYEVSNYAKPQRESAHNFAYWSGSDYLGIGPSAFSTVGARRWQNVPNSLAYADQLFANAAPISFEENLLPATKLGESLAFGLRTNRGVARAALAPWGEEMREFRELGFLENAGERVVLTRKGRLMADLIGEAFV